MSGSFTSRRKTQISSFTPSLNILIAIPFSLSSLFIPPGKDVRAGRRIPLSMCLLIFIDAPTLRKKTSSFGFRTVSSTINILSTVSRIVPTRLSTGTAEPTPLLNIPRSFIFSSFLRLKIEGVRSKLVQNAILVRRTTAFLFSLPFSAPRESIFARDISLHAQGFFYDIPPSITFYSIFGTPINGFNILLYWGRQIINRRSYGIS